MKNLMPENEHLPSITQINIGNPIPEKEINSVGWDQTLLPEIKIIKTQIS